ncbi:hypothetical protein N3T10_004846 [Escherichia coli]|uniref:hypothetical protein n=1 Tax=Escherichia coli TaxID=562 RepID=UPI00097F8091|nr:hypothetical protein [Escherichia coli]EFB3120261.1 hypothetical protein [Escherichia coli]EFB5494165.1 hypothetical protein [Escherichia coli]EFD4947953.1 hypothetical protein [Escherichia coli]EFH5123302.1 hypothetical protein [Escherichia coli]EFH8192233.1 hypothetical protein [Escherichia coli]
MKPEDSVLQELEQLTGRMYQLCEDNDIAFVACYSYKVSTNETESVESRHTSVYIDEEKGVFSSCVAAAYEILRLKYVPRKYILMLEALTELQEKVRKVISDSDNVMH